MTVDDALAKFSGWFSRESLIRNRLVFEGIAAGLWFVIGVAGVTSHGGVLAILSHLILSSTLVLYRQQPFIALGVAAVGTLGMIGSGVFWSGGTTVFIFLPLLAVFFGTSAYGRPVTRWLGLAGTPIATLGIASSAFINVQAL